MQRTPGTALPEHESYIASLAHRAQERTAQAAPPAISRAHTATELIDEFGPALILEAAALVAELAQGDGDETAGTPSTIEVTNLDSSGSQTFDAATGQPAAPEQPAGDTLGEARILDRHAEVYETVEKG